MDRAEPGRSAQPSGPVRILHQITDLDAGGAELALLRLLARLDRDRFPAPAALPTSGGTLQLAARARIAERFSLERAACRYSALYSELARR